MKGQNLKEWKLYNCKADIQGNVTCYLLYDPSSSFEKEVKGRKARDHKQINTSFQASRLHWKSIRYHARNFLVIIKGKIEESKKDIRGNQATLIRCHTIKP